MARRTKTLDVGSVIPVQVTRANIDDSTPCDKGKCMLTLGGIETLADRFGDEDYNVKSTNHGMTFDINGYRILTVFDNATSHRIFQYDEIYKKTRDMAKARAAVRPFKAKLMVESCQKVPVYPRMSEATKKALVAYKKNRPLVKSGINTANRRKISE